MRFLGASSEIVFKLMVTLCQIKIANTSGESWGIESEHHLRELLAKYSRKFIELKRLKEHHICISEAVNPYEMDFTLALRLQFHQLNLIQELSQEKNKNLCPSVYLTDSS